MKSWNRGKKGVYSEETLNKMRLAKLGKKFSDETKKKMSLIRKGKMPKNINQIKGWSKGKHLSKETKEKISIVHKGKKLSEEHKNKIGESLKGKPKSPEHIRKVGDANRGKIITKEQRMKISLSKKGSIPWNKDKKIPQMSGEKCRFWKGGITPLNNKIRSMLEMRIWKSKVFERDNWTCQTCGKRGIKLNSHHIKTFAVIIKENCIKTVEEALNCEELWDIDNGVTLCVDCHNLTKGRKK